MLINFAQLVCVTQSTNVLQIKCILKRLRGFLPSIITDFQHAFVSGREMTENISLTHELCHKINSRKDGVQGLVGLKMDLSKAYDRVSWKFLFRILSAYGFPQIGINLVNCCITSVSYKVMFDRAMSNRFVPSQG